MMAEGVPAQLAHAFDSFVNLIGYKKNITVWNATM